MSDIKLVRLVTGEELLCKRVPGTASAYKDIAIIIPQGAGNLGIMQFMPYATFNEVNFKEQHVMFEVEPKQELVNEYNKVYGSGLVTPPAKKIII